MWDLFSNSGRDLKIAANRTREEDAVKVFANSTSTAFDYMTSEEGVALASSSHTTKSGAATTTGFDNAGTSAVSKTSIAATWILMNQFKDSNGKQIKPSMRMGIICPVNLFDTIMEIVGTEKGFDTAGMDKNQQHNRYEVIPYPLLDTYDTNNWHMVDLDAMKGRAGLVWVDSVKDDIATQVDFQTFNTEVSVYYRAGYGFLDWRWIYSHIVS